MAEYAVRHCNENLDSPPGEQWAYSNQGYYLLGAIIEKATGRTYEDNLKELIFAPLDMKDSGYDSENPPGGRFARGYYSDEGTLIPVGFADTYSAGAIYSTTEDLMKLDRALSSDRILSEASRETLFKPYKGYYGCGWFTTEYEGHLCHSHAGRIGGFPVNIARYPEDGACIIVLSNLDSTPLNDVARNAEAMLFDRDGRLPGRRRSYTPSPESLERWAGTYDLQGLTFKVSAERSGLIVIMQGLPEIRTVPLSENEFGIPAMDAVLSFRENDAGHGVSIFLNMGSVNMLGVRKQGGAGLE
jgi:CubicO group peptidase (beta-lactamase class C family)